MADTLAPERPDQDEDSVGGRHIKSLVDKANDFEGTKTGDAARRLSDGEKNASLPDKENSRPVDEREKDPRIPYNADQMSDKDLRSSLRAQGFRNRRTALIGLGAGGVLSITLGLLSLLPMKIPGLFDLINGYNGGFMEHIMEREAEKVFMKFILRGTNAAVKNGNVIVTGNPLGDLFANLRTARFEDSLARDYGLRFESNGKGGISLIHDGTDLGDFKNNEELEKLLNRNDLSYLESRRVIQLVVRERIPVWRLVKRFKYADFLRLKFIPFFGIGQRNPNETDEEFKTRVTFQLPSQNISDPQLKRAFDFFECLSTACNDIEAETRKDIHNSFTVSKSNEVAKDIQSAGKDLIKSLGDEAKDAAADGLKRTATNFGSRLASKLGIAAALGGATGGIFLAIKLIDIGSVFDHAIAVGTKNNAFLHAIKNLLASSYASFYAFYSGIADSTKAGDVPTEIVDHFSEVFGEVGSAMAFNIMDTGRAIGEGPTNWMKLNNKVIDSTGALMFGEFYNGPVGQVLRGLFPAWYSTVHWLINKLEDTVGKGLLWVVQNTPCAFFLGITCLSSLLFDKLMPVITNVAQYLLMALGFNVDAFDRDVKALNNAAIGGLVGYDAYGKEKLDFHDLKGVAALEQRRRVAEARAEEQSMMPFMERMFSFENPYSLASTLLRRTPSLDLDNGFSQLAFSGVQLAGTIPSSAGRIFSGRVSADDEVTLHDMVGNFDVGVYANELEQPVSPILETNEPCVVNADDHYDPCAAQRAVIDAMSCDISLINLCPEAKPPEKAGGANDNPIVELPDGTAQELAHQILTNPNITFESANDAGKRDFESVSRGEPITTCQWATGVASTINTRLMQVILAAAGNYTGPDGDTAPSRFTFRINAVLSDHNCNGGFHPIGQAVDLGQVNGIYAGGVDGNGDCIPGCGMQTQTYKDFATFIGNALPPGGRIGQTQPACLGHLNIPDGIIQHSDTCHHLHVAVSY